MQGSAVDTHGLDGLPVVPTRVEVLLLDQVELFEIVGAVGGMVRPRLSSYFARSFGLAWRSVGIQRSGFASLMYVCIGKWVWSLLQPAGSLGLEEGEHAIHVNVVIKLLLILRAQLAFSIRLQQPAEARLRCL